MSSGIARKNSLVSRTNGDSVIQERRSSVSEGSTKGKSNQPEATNNTDNSQRSNDTTVVVNQVTDSASFDPSDTPSKPNLEPTATIFSSTTNLSNTILGSGMLAMPSAFASVGLFLGIFMVGFAATTSASGLYLLSICAQRVGHRQTSFYAVSQLTYPNASVFFDLAIAIKCFGVSISYLIVIGDLMPQIMQHFGYPLDSIMCNRRTWISLFMIGLIPLGFMRRLDSLKYTSSIALCSVIYLILIVVCTFFFGEISIPWQEIRWVRLDWNFFTILPVFVFGFTCHQNIFSIHNELIDNSLPRVSRVIVNSIGSGFITYFAIGTLGYLSFGEKVAPNILSMYQLGTVLTLGRFAVVLLALFSYPLQCHPCRACLLKVINSKRIASETSNQGQLYSTVAPGEGDVEYGNIRDTAVKSNEAVSSDDQSPYFTYITVALLICSYSLAMVIRDLDIILSFVGSTGSTAISFILPGLFYLKITQNQPPHIFEAVSHPLPFGASWHGLRRMAARFLVIYGFFVMVICLSFNIKKLAKGKA